MIRQELKSLKSDSQGAIITRLRPCEHQKMISQQVSGDEEQDCSTGQTELCSLLMQLKDNEAIMGEQQATIAQLADTLRRTQTEMELKKFKALHKQQQCYEKQIQEEEQRTDLWIKGLNDMECSN